MAEKNLAVSWLVPDTLVSVVFISRSEEGLEAEWREIADVVPAPVAEQIEVLELLLVALNGRRR